MSSAVPGRLAGKTALITGASRGQGAAEAAAFAEHGARVLLVDILDDLGENVANQITRDGGDVRYLHLDVASEQDWAAAIGYVRDWTGELHVLVNNAGEAHRVGLIDTTLEDWDRIFAINLRGVLLGIRAAAPLMRDSGGGSIVNTGSIAGMTGHFTAAYSASKWGLRGLTKTAAMELLEWRIRANMIHPGIVDTPIIEGSPDFAAAMAQVTPLGRVATVDEIVPAVVFLASDESSFVNGVDIPIDGGFTAPAAYREVVKAVHARGVTNF